MKLNFDLKEYHRVMECECSSSWTLQRMIPLLNELVQESFGLEAVFYSHTVFLEFDSMKELPKDITLASLNLRESMRILVL